MNVKWFHRDALDKIVPYYIQKGSVVLDIGCGIKPQEFFLPKLHICCEPHPEYVKVLQNRFKESANIFILQGKGQDIVKMMPDGSVDSIFLIDVIEHLEKEDGYQLLKECGRVARQQIVLFTPLGFLPQEYNKGDKDAWGFQGGEWQAHKSGWVPDDLDDSWNILGSKVYHLTNGKGDAFDLPIGAFWAIKNLTPIESIQSALQDEFILTLRERDEQIEELRASMQEKDKHILELTAAWCELDEQINGLKTSWIEKDADAVRLNAELNDIKGSLTWKLVMRWHSLVEMTMPQCTMRRSYYNSLVHCLRR